MVALSRVAPPVTDNPPFTVRPWWKVSATSVCAKSESLNVNVPDELSKENTAVLFVLKDRSRLIFLLAASTTIKSPPLSFSESVPRVIVLPLRYRSRHFLVGLPRS